MRLARAALLRADVRLTAFEVDGRHAPECRMASPRVVPTLDIREGRHRRLGFRSEAAPIDELALETGEEALGHCVVVGVSDASHRGSHAHLAATLAERDAGVLATLVAVMDDVGRSSLRDRHV